MSCSVSGDSINEILSCLRQPKFCGVEFDAAFGSLPGPDSPCNDGDPRTVSDVYGPFGQCTGGVPKTCNDTDPCTIDSCDPANGACLNDEDPACSEPCPDHFTPCGGPECIDLSTDPNNCGVCGNPCEGMCSAGVCIPDCIASEEICDGLDNDCDGFVDNNLTPPPCPLQQGVCAGAGAICAGGTYGRGYGSHYEVEEITLGDGYGQ